MYQVRQGIKYYAIYNVSYLKNNFYQYIIKKKLKFHL